MAHHKEKEFTLRIGRKTALVVAAVIVVGSLGYYLKDIFVAAKVDGRFISRFDVIRELESVSGKQALESLITQKLIRAEAKQKGVTVSDDEVNAEMAKVEEQVKAQGGTLEQALSAQGMKLDTLKKQLRTQKLLEKLVTGTTEVNSEEIAQFIKDNNVAIPNGQEEAYNQLVKSQLIQQRLNTAKTAFVNDLRAKASVSIYTKY